MKTIGLLGGMSWESTLTYYQIINMVTAQTLGGLHSARCLLYSVDFDEIERCQQAGDWDRSARILLMPHRLWSGAGRIFWSSAPTPCTRWPRRSPPPWASR